MNAFSRKKNNNFFTAAGDQIQLGKKIKGLKFGKDESSYIEYYPDMRPFSAAMSVCAWIKKLRQEHNTIWFGYCKGGEIVISDSGNYNYWFGGGFAWRNIMTVPYGEWFHLCTTWSYSPNTLRAYYNGHLLKEGSGDLVPLRGNLVIGNDCLGDGNNGNPAYHPFGGELTKLNVFSKELTSAEVKAMYDAGLGSDIEETYGLVRWIRWEDILLLPRTGNVADVPVSSFIGKLTKLHCTWSTPLFPLNQPPVRNFPQLLCNNSRVLT